MKRRDICTQFDISFVNMTYPQLTNEIKSHVVDYCSDTISLADAKSRLMQMFKNEFETDKATKKFTESYTYVMYGVLNTEDMESAFVSRFWDLIGAVLAQIVSEYGQSIIFTINMIRHYLLCNVPEKDIRWHLIHMVSSFLLFLEEGANLETKLLDRVLKKLRDDINDRCPAVRILAIKAISVYQGMGDDLEIVELIIKKAQSDCNLRVRLIAQELFAITSKTATTLTTFTRMKNPAARKLAFKRLGTSVHIRSLRREYRQEVLFHAIQETDADVRKFAHDHFIKYWRNMCCSIEQLVHFLVNEISESRDFYVLEEVMKTYSVKELIDACFEQLPSPDTKGGISGTIKRDKPPLLNYKAIIEQKNITFVKTAWWYMTLKVLKSIDERTDENGEDLMEKIIPASLDYADMIEQYYDENRLKLDSGRKVNENFGMEDYYQTSSAMRYLLKVSNFVDTNDPIGRTKVYNCFKRLLLFDSTCYDWCDAIVNAMKRFAFDDEEYCKDIFYIISEIRQPFSEDVLLEESDVKNSPNKNSIQGEGNTIRADPEVKAKVLSIINELTNSLKKSSYKLSRNETYRETIVKQITSWLADDLEVSFVKRMILEILLTHLNFYRKTKDDIETVVLAFIYSSIEWRRVYVTEEEAIKFFKVVTKFLMTTNWKIINDIANIEVNNIAIERLMSHCNYDVNFAETDFDYPEFILKDFAKFFFEAKEFQNQCIIVDDFSLLLINRKMTNFIISEFFTIYIYDIKQTSGLSSIRDTIEIVLESELLKSEFFLCFMRIFNERVKKFLIEDEEDDETYDEEQLPDLGIIIDFFIKLSKIPFDKLMYEAENCVESLTHLQEIRTELADISKSLKTNKEIEKIILRIDKCSAMENENNDENKVNNINDKSSNISSNISNSDVEETNSRNITNSSKKKIRNTIDNDLENDTIVNTDVSVTKSSKKKSKKNININKSEDKMEVDKIDNDDENNIEISRVTRKSTRKTPNRNNKLSVNNIKTTNDDDVNENDKSWGEIENELKEKLNIKQNTPNEKQNKRFSNVRKSNIIKSDDEDSHDETLVKSSSDEDVIPPSPVSRAPSVKKRIIENISKDISSTATSSSSNSQESLVKSKSMKSRSGVNKKRGHTTDSASSQEIVVQKRNTRSSTLRTRGKKRTESSN